MRRREFLGVAAGTLGASALGTTAARAAGSTALQSAAMSSLGSVEVAGATEAVVDPDGTTVYVATGGGFVVVDVGDPTAPNVVAERRDLLADRDRGPMTGVNDVKVDGDRLVVVGPANSGSPKAMVLFDVSDPTAPERLAVHETSFPIHNADLADGRAYLTGNQFGRLETELVVVDVADDDPTEAGRWSLREYDDRYYDINPFHRVLHDVYVQDDVAYCAYWDAGTWILDVSDPANITHVGHVADNSLEYLLEVRNDGQAAGREYQQPPGNAHYVAVNDDASVMGVGVEAWDVTPDEEGGGPGGVTLYDVSDPSAPVKLSTIEPRPADDESYGTGTWTTAHNFDFDGDRLYTSWYQDGVRAYDVADPATPTLVGEWADPQATAFWTAQATSDGFVGSSVDLSAHVGSQTETRGALYTFPAEATGETTTTTSTTTSTTTTATTATTTNQPGTDATTTTSSSDGQPGLGVPAALAALGLGTWRALRSRDE